MDSDAPAREAGRWLMDRNAWFVFAAKAIRTFCYGFMAVLVPIHLAELGFGKKELGLTFSLTLLGSAFITWLVVYPSRRYGSRRVLIILHAVTVLSALLFLFGRRPWVLILAAMVGNLAVGVGETGPFLALEQVLIVRAVPTGRLTGVLSFYNLLGYVCAALGGAAVARISGHPRIFFTTFLLSGAAQSLIYVFAHAGRGPAKIPMTHAPSRPLVRKIAGLFALDAFGGGFILQSWIVYWFYVRFHLDLGSLGWVYFATQTATGLSLLFATPLSRGIGLVNAMVFSHLASNAFLMAVAWAPTAAIAIGLLIARHLLSQIDVPTRQSFLMLAVCDEEREHASTFTTMSRTLSQAVSPALTGWLMQVFSSSAPFAFGGGLKIVYDLLLYQTVKNIPLMKPTNDMRGA